MVRAAIPEVVPVEHGPVDRGGIAPCDPALDAEGCSMVGSAFVGRRVMRIDTMDTDKDRADDAL